MYATVFDATPTGDSYMLFEQHGGTWSDAEKRPPDDGAGNPPPVDPGEEDDLMCWAATASNVLEWTGWGVVSGMVNSDQMFQHFQDHWTDQGGFMEWAWRWWFDGVDLSGGHVDVLGGGNFWSLYAFSDYFHEEWTSSNAMGAVDDYLHNGYGVGIAIYNPPINGAHAITAWGYNYNPFNPSDYYGIWVTDSDDSKTSTPAPDLLRYYEVSYSTGQGRWYLQDFYGSNGWYIGGVEGLGAFPTVHNAPAVLSVRGMDNRIFYRTHSISDSWSEWFALPGATCDSPAVALLGTNAHFVVRGSDGTSLWHGYANLNTQEFSGWTWISGATPSAPTLTSNGTTLCLVVRGNDDGIYYRFYSFSSWGSWLRVPDGSTCDAPAATLVGNNLHIVVRGMDGSGLWHRVVRYDGASVKAWTLIGGATDRRPVMVAYPGAGYLYLSVKGLDGGIYFHVYILAQDVWDPQWIKEPGATCDGPAIAIHNGQMLVAVRGMDGDSLWHEHVNGVPWSWLSGATPSAPTLAAAPV